jgi:murein DD-endopeptidase MepM/ murein hydrolase activator NlpD
VEDIPGGKQWLAVSENVLLSPQPIKLPYRQVGHFPTDKPRALALQFSARQGERIIFDLAKKAGIPFAIFADVFKQDSAEATHLLAVDTIDSVFSFDINETGNYILRLQPELNRSGQYNLSASVAPSLAFPVAGKKAKAGSFWGAARDAGKRNHEGIDIFAPKLTPAIAAAEGYITRVAKGGIGGKTIWLKAKDHNVTLYYAHLDQQLVKEGQDVKTGDTLGLIGNTGNAKYTPPHLHFGIYTFAGPVDPFPFVNTEIKSAAAFPAKDLDVHLKFRNSSKGKNTATTGDTALLVPLAVTANNYIAELPDGKIIQIPFSSVKTVKVEKKQDNVATDNALKNASGG